MPVTAACQAAGAEVSKTSPPVNKSSVESVSTAPVACAASLLRWIYSIVVHDTGWDTDVASGAASCQHAPRYQAEAAQALGTLPDSLPGIFGLCKRNRRVG